MKLIARLGMMAAIAAAPFSLGGCHQMMGHEGHGGHDHAAGDMGKMDMMACCKEHGCKMEMACCKEHAAAGAAPMACCKEHMGPGGECCKKAM